MAKLNYTNPFLSLLDDLRTNVRTAVCARGEVVSLVDEGTGEIRGKGYNAVVREKQYDSERFVKLYAAGRSVLPKLSGAATKVLWFLIDGMGYEDTVTLNIEKAKFVTGYKSEAAIYRAISELKRHYILANGYRNGVYFVNPSMFYRGNRLKLLNQF